jgi:hypothetical protein
MPGIDATIGGHCVPHEIYEFGGSDSVFSHDILERKDCVGRDVRVRQLDSNVTGTRVLSRALRGMWMRMRVGN